MLAIHQSLYSNCSSIAIIKWTSCVWSNHGKDWTNTKWCRPFITKFRYFSPQHESGAPFARTSCGCFISDKFFNCQPTWFCHGHSQQQPNCLSAVLSFIPRQLTIYLLRCPDHSRQPSVQLSWQPFPHLPPCTSTHSFLHSQHSSSPLSPTAWFNLFGNIRIGMFSPASL